MPCEPKFATLNSETDFVLQLKIRLFIQKVLTSSDIHVSLAKQIFTVNEMSELNICEDILVGNKLCSYHDKLGRILSSLNNQESESDYSFHDATSPHEYLNRVQLRMLYTRCREKKDSHHQRRSLKTAMRKTIVMKDLHWSNYTKILCRNIVEFHNGTPVFQQSETNNGTPVFQQSETNEAYTSNHPASENSQHKISETFTEDPQIFSTSETFTEDPQIFSTSGTGTNTTFSDDILGKIFQPPTPMSLKFGTELVLDINHQDVTVEDNMQIVNKSPTPLVDSDSCCDIVEDKMLSSAVIEHDYEPPTLDTDHNWSQTSTSPDTPRPSLTLSTPKPWRFIQEVQDSNVSPTVIYDNDMHSTNQLVFQQLDWNNEEDPSVFQIQ